MWTRKFFVFPKNLLHTPHINLVGGGSATGVAALAVSCELVSEGSNNLGNLVGVPVKGVPTRLGDPGKTESWAEGGVATGAGRGVETRL